jgi:hypothetical protein
MLLWRHRAQTGLSAEANYERFYPGYARPTSRWIVRGSASGIRALGHRAMPLGGPANVIDFSATHPPSSAPERPSTRRGGGAPLADLRSLPPGPAIYRPVHIEHHCALFAQPAAAREDPASYRHLARTVIAFRRSQPDARLTLQEAPTLFQLDALQRRELKSASCTVGLSQQEHRRRRH